MHIPLTVRMNPKKGIIFDKKKYILDPYAKAVIGQSGWGKKQEHEGCL